LLFALAIHPLLTRLKSKCDLVAAYLDDITLQGSSEQVREAIELVEEEGPEYGVYLSSDKTVVWWPESHGVIPHNFDMFSNFHRTLGLGVELLGGALSKSYEYVVEVVMKRVNKCVVSAQMMMALQDPQLCLLLLRACELMPKLMYCWRTTHPSHLGTAAKGLDEVVATFNLERGCCVWWSSLRRFSAIPVNVTSSHGRIGYSIAIRRGFIRVYSFLALFDAIAE
jgi:hypothetical protein